MTRYRFLHWEKPEELNPKREINITKDTELIAYYEVIETRKGLPSESNVVVVTVFPLVEKEATILNMVSDKHEYNAGETITLTGVLKFIKDSISLPNRTISLLENNVHIGNVTTNAAGEFTKQIQAEAVTSEQEFAYLAKFAGDP